MSSILVSRTSKIEGENEPVSAVERVNTSAEIIQWKFHSGRLTGLLRFTVNLFFYLNKAS